MISKLKYFLTSLVFAIFFFLGISWFFMIRMPGRNYQGALNPLTLEERELQKSLQREVQILAGDIGERNDQYPEKFEAAAHFIEEEMREAGYKVYSQEYEVKGQLFKNLEVEIRGKTLPDEIVVVGAHYDSVLGSPGANDNGTGTAATLELAKKFADKNLSRTLRFVWFVNEEPPFFWTNDMGSLVYAQRAFEKKEKIIACLSLETLGFYSQEKQSQDYPPPLNWIYPSQGNFVAFVGNLSSGSLTRKAIQSFRSTTSFPSEGVALPNFIPGVGWSDHWSFWQVGYLGIMITDTAPFRYPHYHEREDTPDKIDYESLARVVKGLEKVIEDLTL